MLLSRIKVQIRVKLKRLLEFAYRTIEITLRANSGLFQPALKQPPLASFRTRSGRIKLKSCLNCLPPSNPLGPSPVISTSAEHRLPFFVTGSKTGSDQDQVILNWPTALSRSPFGPTPAFVNRRWSSHPPRFLAGRVRMPSLVSHAESRNAPSTSPTITCREIISRKPGCNGRYWHVLR